MTGDSTEDFVDACDLRHHLVLLLPILQDVHLLSSRSRGLRVDRRQSLRIRIDDLILIPGSSVDCGVSDVAASVYWG